MSKTKKELFNEPILEIVSINLEDTIVTSVYGGAEGLYDEGDDWNV